MSDAVALVVAEILLQLVPIINVGLACVLVWAAVHAFQHLREALGYGGSSISSVEAAQRIHEQEQLLVHGPVGDFADTADLSAQMTAGRFGAVVDVQANIARAKAEGRWEEVDFDDPANQ